MIFFAPLSSLPAYDIRRILLFFTLIAYLPSLSYAKSTSSSSQKPTTQPQQASGLGATPKTFAALQKLKKLEQNAARSYLDYRAVQPPNFGVNHNAVNKFHKIKNKLLQNTINAHVKLLKHSSEMRRKLKVLLTISTIYKEHARYIRIMPKPNFSTVVHSRLSAALTQRGVPKRMHKRLIKRLAPQVQKKLIKHYRTKIIQQRIKLLRAARDYLLSAEKLLNNPKNADPKLLAHVQKKRKGLTQELQAIKSQKP
mgnify:CR=1 FL=1